jgi:hypothetical protein
MSQDPAPYYQIHAFVCTNRRDDNDPRGSCAARGSDELRDYLKKKAKQAGLIKGERVERLLLQPEDRRRDRPDP